MTIPLSWAYIRVVTDAEKGQTIRRDDFSRNFDRYEFHGHATFQQDEPFFFVKRLLDLKKITQRNNQKRIHKKKKSMPIEVP